MHDAGGAALLTPPPSPATSSQDYRVSSAEPVGELPDLDSG